MTRFLVQRKQKDSILNLKQHGLKRNGLVRPMIIVFLLPLMLAGFQNCRSNSKLITKGTLGITESGTNVTSLSSCETLNFSPTHITYYYLDEDDLSTKIIIDLQNATVELEDELEDEDVFCQNVSVADNAHFLTIQNALTSTVQNCATEAQTQELLEQNDDYLSISFEDETTEFEIEYPTSETMVMTPSWSDVEEALDELVNDVSENSSCSFE